MTTTTEPVCVDLYQICSCSVFQNLSVCMGGCLLSQVCQLFCKQYRQSVGGLPDLVLWNPDARTCKVCVPSSHDGNGYARV